MSVPDSCQLVPDDVTAETHPPASGRVTGRIEFDGTPNTAYILSGATTTIH